MTHRELAEQILDFVDQNNAADLSWFADEGGRDGALTRIAEILDRNCGDQLQIALGALADIANSEDMTLETARRKAARIYEQCASVTSAVKFRP